jgi:KaiC/GvpD/RAD55 family RecA-like ATPase
MNQSSHLNNVQPRESTGINRLDEVLGGGFPRPSIIAVIGAPGSGTTSFCKQFIVSSLRGGRRVLVVCGDEPSEHYMRNFDSMESFDIERYKKEKKLFIFDVYEAFTQFLGINDYTNLELNEGSPIDTIMPMARKYFGDQADQPPTGFNIVLDSITSLSPFIGLRDIYKAILEAQQVARAGNHVLVFTGHEGALEGNFVQALRKYVNGVIRMRMRWVRTKLEREMIIEKMGFTEIKQPVVGFNITDTGIDVV